MAVVKTIEGNPLPTAARDLARQARPAALGESDALILRTDGQIIKLYDAKATRQEQERILVAALEVVPEALSKVSQACCNEEKERRGEQNDEESPSIGLEEIASKLEKMTFVGNFLLKLYNLPPAKDEQTSIIFRNAFAGSLAPNLIREQAYPKVLIDWLAENHSPYRTAFARLRTHKPNATASASFWDLFF